MPNPPACVLVLRNQLLECRFKRHAKRFVTLVKHTHRGGHDRDLDPFPRRDEAHEVGLNLVEVSPGADPPVCKILDVGKFKYEAQKKAAAARKNQKTQEIKEIKMRPNIDDHDYDTKMKAVARFIEEGDKVKLTLRFRGRELSHGELGLRLLERVRDDSNEYAKVEQTPKMEGRQMLMVIAPR